MASKDKIGPCWAHKSLPNPSGLTPYALLKLSCTRTRKNCAFCSSVFIFALFLSNRIKTYLETFRDSREQRHGTTYKSCTGSRTAISDAICLCVTEVSYQRFF